MTNPECKRYETCDVPLCPLDEQSLKHGIWYPDEDICNSRTSGNFPWIKAQRKIAKKAARTDRYFNLQMLERNCIVRKGIEGLDPDQAEEYQLEKWLKAHPEKRSLSKEERKVIGQRLAGARA